MRSSSGQASVEFVALVPFVVLAVAGLLQVCVVAHAAWAGSQAASAAARAAAVGADVREAARSALPAHLERGLRVVDLGGGDVRVAVRPPSLIPSLDFGSVSAVGRFQEQS